MAFTSGTRFGPYEISERIGAGGMGEVYRATDTNLKRDVAINVLRVSLANDESRLVGAGKFPTFSVCCRPRVAARPPISAVLT